MLKPLIRICIAATVVVMAGCATQIVPNAPDEVSAAKLDSKTGVLVGSFSRITERQEHVSHAIYFQHENPDYLPYEIRSFHGNDMLGLHPEDDFHESDREGLLFAFVLPAGNYHFVSYALESGEGHWRPTKPFSVPFKVEAGKVNYVGDIHLVVNEGKDIFGMTTAKGGKFHFINAKNKDIPILKNKYPDIPWADLAITVPNHAREYPKHSIASE
jgi:hypothetical protein